MRYLPILGGCTMVNTSLTYSDLRYWYLSEIRRLRKARHSGNETRNTKEQRAIRCKMAELRLARRGPDAVRITGECVILRPWG
jgi:hypothetical protein